MGMTTLYLSKAAREKLQQALGGGVDVQLDSYTLSNGVCCEGKNAVCYIHKFSSRWGKTMTQRQFGR
ncbi:YcgJ family protein [Enterobacter ludwigii]|uniref:YcgJ family protein n=1 Tax=Enterobacter ludwigii TaxID=299767 RepID=UPI003BEF34DE